nr:tRNA (adenosine(37)-N6)-threonylcarbamoyltransferase complex dimerization subunit type 1 TsaB [Conexibacter arvalis]
MTILAFDTATPATSVALALDDGRLLSRRHDPAPGERPGHQELLLGFVVALLEEAGVELPAVDRIAVGVGPGTFTGLRIGVATARGLAHAHDLPLVAVSTLHALAAQAAAPPAAADQAAGEHPAATADQAAAPPAAGEPAATGDQAAAGQAPADGEAPPALLAVLDARRGEAFAAAWPHAAAADPRAAPLLAPAALSPEALAAAVAELPAASLAVGDGALRFREQLQAAGAVVPADGSSLHRVDAVAHCRLGAALEPLARDEVVPTYLRLPDAELALRRRGERE